MKYKIQGSTNKCAIKHLEIDKYDWILWYGPEKDQCYQIQGLFRSVPTDQAHANCIDTNSRYLRAEQLTFQSRKAVVRWVRKHKEWIINDYKLRNAGRLPHWVMATHWHHKGVFYLTLDS